MYFIWIIGEKNLRKPVKTQRMKLTKRAERLKVNCGTVLRTRMNTEDSHWRKGRVERWFGQGQGNGQ